TADPLTSHDQACLAQQFCAYFYQQYCTPRGDLQMTSFNQQPSTTTNLSKSEYFIRSKAISRDQSEIREELDARPEQRHALCPFFYTGSLSEAMQLSARPSGRPWPAILLYLHNDESPHTSDFVNNIICCLREDYKQDPSAGHPAQTAGYIGFTRDHFDDEGLSRSPLDKNDSVATSGFPAHTAARIRHQRTGLAVKRNESPKNSHHAAANEKLRLSFRSTTRKNALRCRNMSPVDQTVNTENEQRDCQTDESALTECKIHSPINLILDVIHKSGEKTKEPERSDMNHASITHPSEGNRATDSDESGSDEPSRLPTNSPACREHEDVENQTATDVDNEKSDLFEAYGTAFATKSFRGLLLERSAGLIPWDCTDIRGRSYLAEAFAGTRLAQWLAEWNTFSRLFSPLCSPIKPEHYPALVAIGRTAERTVICSHLRGSNVSTLEALRWLNGVTLAHFYNYRQSVIPTCPESSEKLNVTPSTTTTPPVNPVLSGMIQPNISPQPSPSTLATYTNQAIPTLQKSSPGKTNAAKLIEHKSTSSVIIHTISKKGISPSATDEIAYRVGTTPQNLESVIPTCPESSEKLNCHSEYYNYATGKSSTFWHDTAEHLSPTLPEHLGHIHEPSDSHSTKVQSRKQTPPNSLNTKSTSSVIIHTISKKGISPSATDEIAYRVGTTPQNLEGPLSSIFEETVDPPSNRLRERLKRVQKSFKNATTALANSISVEALASLEIQINSGRRRKPFSTTKSTSAQALVNSLRNPITPDPQRPVSSSGLLLIHREQRQGYSESEAVSRSESGIRANRGPRFFEKMGIRNGRSSELRPKRPDQSSPGGSADNENCGSYTARFLKSEREWWRFLAQGKHVVNFNNQADFYDKFSERYTVDFPSTPAFLIGRIQTAFFRTMDVRTHEQIIPILVYLHDNRAPGADHFVANVLCSRRFTNKLFENSTLIWPYDVSKAAYVQTTERHESNRTHKKLRAVDLSSRSLTETDKSGAAKAHRRTASSFGRFSHRAFMDSSKKLCDNRREPLSDLSESTGCLKKNTPIPRNYSSVRNNHGVFKHLHSIAAQRLLDYFSGHPAEESIRRLLSVPVLPSLINLHYSHEEFSVTHVLVPSATTKEAISWLGIVLKLYNKP
ncbi:hypothetical protein FGIG_04676, partial [Fasciola gigantica]